MEKHRQLVYYQDTRFLFRAIRAMSSARNQTCTDMTEHLVTSQTIILRLQKTPQTDHGQLALLWVQHHFQHNVEIIFMIGSSKGS